MDFYYKPRVDYEILKEYHEGVIALSACLAGEVQRYIGRGQYEKGKEAALHYQEIFGEGNFFLELQDHGIPMQKTVNQGLVRMSAETGLNWWLPTIFTIPMRKMPHLTIFYCAFRPARKWQMRTGCAMRGDSITVSRKKR